MPSDEAPQVGDGRISARAARVLCCITFHFVRDRLQSLADVLQALSEFPVANLEVVIVTNEIGENDAALLCRLATEIVGEGAATICRVGDLEHPFDLAWHHKHVLAERFVAHSDDQFTHFIYLEDDIRFTFANFEYFVETRERLRGAGLLPAFVRVEWSGAAGGLVASDAFWPVYVPTQPHIRVDGQLFVGMANPYNPCFVLDRALVREHLASPAFDRSASSHVVAWGVRERAAMGLCLENAPRPFRWRYVVPVSALGRVPPHARVLHLHGTYANADTALAKTRLDSLFKGAEPSGSDWWPGVTDSGGSSRFFLVTHHDTVVYFDWMEMALRHGPLGIAPLNLTAELAASEVVLRASGEEGRTHRLSFECEAAGEDCIGLRRADRYACAESGGLVHVDRSVMSDWETFGLMRLDTVSGIGVLARHSWKGDVYRGVVRLEAQPITFWPWQGSPASAIAAGIVRNMPATRDGVAFGEATIRLVARRRQLEFSFEESGGARQPAGVAITEDGGRILRWSRVTSDD